MAGTITRREAIVEEFARRLSEIRIANGFQTDAGSALWIGEVPALGESEPRIALALLVGDELVKGTAEHVNLTLPIEICAVAQIGLQEAWRVVEWAIADIKTAIETMIVGGVRVTDKARDLAGQLPGRIERDAVRNLPREAGVTITGCSVTYLVPYPEPWGEPRIPL